MVVSKYEKYIIRRPAIMGKDGKLEFPNRINTEGKVDTGPLVWRSPELMKETNSYVEHGIISGDVVVGEDRPGGIEISHKHDNFSEIFLFVGTNPNDPTDLGAEAEFCLGEGEEQEKILINTSSSIYVPPGMAHFPLTWKKVKRPCILVVARCC